MASQCTVGHQDPEWVVERSEPTGRNSYRALVGKPGVVYVLENDGLRHGWLKIGCSTRSGHARAIDLNTDANTGTPGVFRCIYQLRTMDCGTAEQEVFTKLSAHRRGKWGQEFFEVDLALAKETIRVVCSEVDQRGAMEPPLARATLGDDLAYHPPTGAIPKLERPPAGVAARRSRWRQSRGRPRRKWSTVVIIIGVVVVIAMAQREEKSQPATSRQTPQGANSAPKAARPTVGAKPAMPAQAGNAATRQDGAVQAATSHATQEPGSNGDPSVPLAPKAGASHDAGSSSEAMKAFSKAPEGEAPGGGRGERSSSAASCSSEWMLQDPAAYSRCLSNKSP